MKNLFFVFFAFLKFSFLSAQPDSVKLIVTLARIFEDGKQTTKDFTYLQQVFDRQNVPIRDVYYDDKTFQVSKYVVYFSEQDKVLSEEHYTARDSFLMAKKFTYNTNGLKTGCEVYTKTGGQLVSSGGVYYVYNGSLLTEMKEYSLKNKIIKQTIYTYNADNKIVNSITKFKKPYLNGVKEIDTTYIYNTDGFLTEKVILGKSAKNAFDTTIVKFTYDKKSKKLIEEAELKNSAIISKKLYEYFQGKVNVYTLIDKDGNPVKIHSYMYKDWVINKGNNLSVFENPPK